MAARPREPDWKELLASWDRQQESFNPDRERRFEVMFEVLEARLPRRFTALDLGCGPGSLTARLLRRFPAARSVAVDFDPVVLRIAREAIGSVGGRAHWVDADLKWKDWTTHLPVRTFDAAVSTTALHWLAPDDLRRLYGDLGTLVRRGGVFLNGDYLPWDSGKRALRRLTEKVRSNRFGGKPLNSEWGGWKEWWEKAEKEPGLREEFRERKARSAQHPHTREAPVEFHERALRRAGFREVAVIWQDFENRVLLAIR